MFLILFLERRVTSHHRLYLNRSFSRSCCLWWTRTMQKSCFLWMISIRSVVNIQQKHPLGVKLEASHTQMNKKNSTQYWITVFVLQTQHLVLSVSSGVCFSIDKECSPAAPGDGLLHLLLPSWLQSRTSFWLQTADGKSTWWVFFFYSVFVRGIAVTSLFQ